MKRASAAATAKAQPAVLPLRVWRVFEYRRPLPVRRPRFTT
jgi:hypothetical protein